MTLGLIGKTVLGVAGVCGTAAVWSHVHDSHAAEARGHSRRGEQFSRRERGDSNFARDITPRRRKGGARAWDDRGREDR
jgi:hypothetical protein